MLELLSKAHPAEVRGIEPGLLTAGGEGKQQFSTKNTQACPPKNAKPEKL